MYASVSYLLKRVYVSGKFVDEKGLSDIKTILAVTKICLE
jgi:hypothetical protein